MITVIASIRVKPGTREAYLDVLKGNLAGVRAEAGCHEYRPTIDTPSGLAAQQMEPDVVTLLEKWATLDALRAHLAAPHMAAYREKVKGMVVSVSLKVLTDA